MRRTADPLRVWIIFRCAGLFGVGRWPIIRVTRVLVGRINTLLALINHMRFGMAHIVRRQIFAGSIFISASFWAIGHVKILNAS